MGAEDQSHTACSHRLFTPAGGGARLVFACGTLRQLNRFVRHGLRLPGPSLAAGGGGAASLALDGLTLTDELGLEIAQAHPATAGGGTPALLVRRVVLAVLVPGSPSDAPRSGKAFASGKASLLPSYVVDYALEAMAAQLLDSN